MQHTMLKHRIILDNIILYSVLLRAIYCSFNFYVIRLSMMGCHRPCSAVSHRNSVKIDAYRSRYIYSANSQMQKTTITYSNWSQEAELFFVRKYLGGRNLWYNRIHCLLCALTFIISNTDSAQFMQRRISDCASAEHPWLRPLFWHILTLRRAD